MTKQVTVDELESHLRARLDDVRNGESLRIVDGATAIGTIEPAKRTVKVIRHDPALRLQDFEAGAPLPCTGSVEWLIGERERERSGKKRQQ